MAVLRRPDFDRPPGEKAATAAAVWMRRPPRTPGNGTRTECGMGQRAKLLEMTAPDARKVLCAGMCELADAAAGMNCGIEATVKMCSMLGGKFHASIARV